MVGRELSRLVANTHPKVLSLVLGLGGTPHKGGLWCFGHILGMVFLEVDVLVLVLFQLVDNH